MKLSVVVPTISGREESLARAIASYEDTCADIEHEVLVMQDYPTWPQACNAGYTEAEGDNILFTSDDLEALPGWWQAGIGALEERPDELPAPRVYDYLSPPDGKFANETDGDDGEVTLFTRIPLMSRAQCERIGPWPAITYYADLWLSVHARRLGIETRMVYGFDFIHHWCQIGRVDSTENLDQSGIDLKKLLGKDWHEHSVEHLAAVRKRERGRR